MNPWPIVRAFLVRHRWAALAFVFLVAAGVSLAVALVSQERALRAGSARAADRFDLIVAAPGSQTDVLLTAVFLRPGTTKLLPPEVTVRLLNDKRAVFVAPIGFGDSHRGAPIVGTTSQLVTHLSNELQEGRVFAHREEAVVGAASPMKVGETFQPTHGIPRDGNPEEDADPHEHGAMITVVGRMKPTGSPWDSAIMVPVELVWHLHSLPDGHEEGSEAVGPPFDQARTPGVPAAVVRPTTIAAAYQLRNAYTTNDSMAFFPAEALTRLYSVMGDLRQLMSLLAIVTQALVLMAIMMGVLLLFRFLVPQLITLRALGAPRLFIAAIAWGFTATLVLAGVLLGLGAGDGLSYGVSQWLAADTGVELTPTLASREYLIAASILATGWILALLPAYVVQRRSLAISLAES